MRAVAVCGSTSFTMRKNHFFFYEVYRDEAAHQKHSTYPHYARWAAARDQVIAEPITRSLCTVLFPKDYK